jgi:hypothetical protein
MTEIILHEKHWPIVPDSRDLEIARARVDEMNKDQDPRVGDWVIMPDGTRERFAYRCPDGLQTCTDWSFYLGEWLGREVPE